MGNKHNTGHGFTLIELLIVLVIIGILIGIGVPLLSKNLPAAKQTAFRENVDQIVDALEVYRSRAYIAGADCYYPESLQELAEGGYFTKIPINPYTGTSMLTDSATLSGLVYKRSDDCRGYTITLMDGMGDIAMGDSTSSGGSSQTGVFKVQITASPADVGYNKVMIATAGSTVTLPSVPDTTCYQFVNYTLNDPTLVLHDNKFVMPAHNVSVVAQYALKPNSQVTITYTGTPARTGVGTITNTYTCGSKVVLQAPQVTYYTFAGWFDTNNHIVSSANPWVFTAARDMTLWANYRSSIGTILYEHTGTVTVSTNTYTDTIDTTYSLYVPTWTLEYDVRSDVGATTSGMGVFIGGPLVTISQGVYNEGVLRSIGLSVGKQGDSSVYTWTHVKVAVEQDSVNTAKYTYYINGNYHHTDFGQPIINPKQVVYNTSGSSQSVSYKNVIVYTNNTYTLRHVNIAWSPTNGGVVTPSVGYTVLDGTPVVVDFTAATGYHIDNVTINGNRANIGQVTRTQPTSYHLSTVANSDLVITASFVINTHVITLNPNGGTVAPTTISANYGATVSLPTPVRTNYTFQGWWTDPVGGTQWTSTMPVVKDITLYAHWVGMCQLTISVSPQDPSVYVAVTLDGNTTNVYTTTTITATTGSTIQLQAVSSSLCYVFDKYSGYNNSTSSVISITAPVGPKSITAHFIRPQFTIRTAIGSAGGSVTPLGTFTVPCGTSTTITFTPSTGYYVSSVLVDGTNKGSNISMVTFNDIVTSHTVTVNFAANVVITFTRNSVAYTDDGTQVGVNIPRYKPGKFGQGIFIEEGTTNLLTENQSSVEIDTSGLGGWGGATRTRDTTTTWHGGYSFKAIGGSSTFSIYTLPQLTSVTAGTAYTGSVYVKSSAPQSLAGNFAMWWRPNPTASSITANLTTNWQRVVATEIAPSGASSVHLEMYSAGNYTIWWDGAQLEAKPYATSWTLGGTTRAPEVLTVSPVSSILSPQQGTIETWVYVPEVWQHMVYYLRRIWGIREESGPGMYWLGYDPTDGKIKFSIYNNYGVAQTISTNKPTVGWHHFVARWSPTEMALFIDGTKVGSISNPSLPSSFADTKLAIGCRTTPPGTLEIYDNINTVIDDLRISNRARTDQEIQALYQSNQPAPKDADTTLKLNFDGNLNP